MNHPAVTAPIVGPRTMEHPESPLPAAGVVLDPALLDTINPAGTDAVSQNTDGRGVTPNGRVILYIGSSVRDIRLTDTVTVSSGTCAQDSDAEGGDGAGGSDGGGSGGDSQGSAGPRAPSAGSTASAAARA